MERIVSIRAVHTALTRHATDSTDTVCVMTDMVNSEIELVQLFCCLDSRRIQKKCIVTCFCTDSMRSVKTTDIPSNTIWIVAFSISMAIHMIFITVSCINRRYYCGFDLILL